MPPAPRQDAAPGYAIESYTLWRRIMTTAAAEQLHRGRKTEGAEPGPGSVRVTTTAGARSVYWEFVASVPARGAPGYAYMAATGSDSLPGSIPWNVFFVDAKLTGSSTFYVSPVDSGYSVDNLSPATPGPFSGQVAGGDTHLHWSPNRESDLGSYRLYRGGSADFVPAPGNLIATQADTALPTPGARAPTTSSRPWTCTGTSRPMRC